MFNSVHGRIQRPNLDDRTWQEIVDEARALIPKYAPQWTDHNASDLGITLIELFAWLVEGLIYRLNRIPENNYIAFLNLLGIKRDPAVPAHTYLTFTAQPGTVKVPKGKQAQTQGTETAPPIIFETDEDITVLPTNLKTVLTITKVITNVYTDISSTLTVPPASGLSLSVPNGKSTLLCLGFDQQTAAEIRLNFQFHRPVSVDPLPGGAQASVTWLYSSGALEPSAWTTIPGVTDETQGLQRDGIVRFTVPGNWASQAPDSWTTVTHAAIQAMTDARFWIGVRISNLLTEPIQIGIDHLLFNSASAHNALTIPVAEGLGRSNGKPFQVFSLPNRPLFKQPDTGTPYDHLDVEVADAPSPWRLVDDLPAGAGNVYRLDPVAGEIRFGNFDATSGKGNGSIPPDQAQITATAYRYVVGGTQGNVGAGTINEMRTPVFGIVAVTNLSSSFDGADEEPIEDTLRRAPETLRIRDRAVTADDYEFLAREASTDVSIVRCLEPRVQTGTGLPWTFGAINRSPGNVNVIIVPDQNVARPIPSQDLIREVQGYLDKRRDLTVRLVVTGPRYLPVVVTVNIAIWQRAISAGKSQAAIEAETRAKIVAFLHPTHGGIDNKGWQVGQSVFIADLFHAIMPPPEIGYISSVLVQPDTPEYHFPPIGEGGVFVPAKERPFPLSLAGTSVRTADYELICSANPSLHVVTSTVET